MFIVCLCFVGHQLKIVDQDDCDFFFDVKKYANGQLFLTQTQGFIEQWNLKEGDEISFEYDDEIGAFVVNTKGNDNSQVAEKPSCTKATSTDEKTNISKTITETYQSVVDTYRNTFKENHYLPTKNPTHPLLSMVSQKETWPSTFAIVILYNTLTQSYGKKFPSMMLIVNTLTPSSLTTIG